MVCAESLAAHGHPEFDPSQIAPPKTWRLDTARMTQEQVIETMRGFIGLMVITGDAVLHISEELRQFLVEQPPV